MQTIQAGEFKAKCLEIMNQVALHHQEYLITKRGIPVAKIVPVAQAHQPFGLMMGSVSTTEDLTQPHLTESWDASL